MAQFFTSNTLISSVKRRSMMPTNQSTFSDEDFLAFANEEISLGLLPSIMRLHEDYYLYTEDIALEAGKSNYPISHRAIGNKLRDVSYKDTNGNLYEMTRIGIQDISDYNGSYSVNAVNAFYIKNNEIVLQPEIIGSVSGSLFTSYYLRPNELVTEDKAAVITNIDRNTGVISVANVPDEFSTSITYDFIQAKSPFISLGIEVSIVSVNSTLKEVTFSIADIPERLAVGDYVNKSGETIVPQIPADLHVVLAHRVAARCLEALGDFEGLQSANQKLAEMEDKTTNLIDNRVEEAPKKVVNRNGLLRSGLYRRRLKNRG